MKKPRKDWKTFCHSLLSGQEDRKSRESVTRSVLSDIDQLHASSDSEARAALEGFIEICGSDPAFLVVILEELAARPSALSNLRSESFSPIRPSRPLEDSETTALLKLASSRDPFVALLALGVLDYSGRIREPELVQALLRIIGSQETPLGLSMEAANWLRILQERVPIGVEPFLKLMVEAPKTWGDDPGRTQDFFDEISLLYETEWIRERPLLLRLMPIQALRPLLLFQTVGMSCFSIIGSLRWFVGFIIRDA